MRLGGVLRKGSVARTTGAAIAAAGVMFIGLGTAGVGTITGGATTTTTILGNASTVNASSGCDNAVAWHFVLPGGGDSPPPNLRQHHGGLREGGHGHLLWSLQARQHADAR